MRGKYTIINEEKARHFRCPFPFTDADGSVCTCCTAGQCMAWIEELNSVGSPTGRGRCGMVAGKIEMMMPE